MCFEDESGYSATKSLHNPLGCEACKAIQNVIGTSIAKLMSGIGIRHANGVHSSSFGGDNSREAVFDYQAVCCLQELAV